MVETSDPAGATPESMVFPYASATSFRTALKDRFAAIVKTDSRYTLDELQRRFAYDRVLARLFTGADADRWVLKGAGALLARLEQARHSKDIDVYYAEQAAPASEAASALRLALGRDLCDFFAFEVTRIVPLQEVAKGSRVHVLHGATGTGRIWSNHSRYRPSPVCQVLRLWRSSTSVTAARARPRLRSSRVCCKRSSWSCSYRRALPPSTPVRAGRSRRSGAGRAR